MYTPAQKLKMDMLFFFNLFVSVVLKFIFICVALYFFKEICGSIINILDSAEAIVSFLISLLYSYVVSFFGFFFLRKKKPKTEKKEVFFLRLTSLKNMICKRNGFKKLCIFEKKTKGKKKNFLISILRILSYLNTLEFLRILFLSASFYLDYGRSYALVYVLHMVLTYALFYLPVRARLFSLYGNDCLRLLNWNVITKIVTNFSKTSIIIGGTGGVLWFADGEAGVRADSRVFDQKAHITEIQNAHANHIRLRDPEGASKGKYEYVDYTKGHQNYFSLLKHAKNTFKDLNDLGQEVDKAQPSTRITALVDLFKTISSDSGKTNSKDKGYYSNDSDNGFKRK